MITIIHGDDISSSRKYYNEQKPTDSLSFDGEKVNSTDITQGLEGGGLFSDTKKIFIDNFLTKRKIGREVEEIIEILNKNSKTNEIFLWEEKEITKKTLSLFKNTDLKLFKLPQNIFNFLDSIRPNNKNSILLFHETLKTSEPEFIFFMIIRQFRLLLALSEESRDGEIDELKRMSPWQRTKLKKQAYLFSTDDLKRIYKRLFEIDLGQKTGSLNMTLEQAIDILLLEI